jgi:hypothetical protein
MTPADRTMLIKAAVEDLLHNEPRETYTEEQLAFAEEVATDLVDKINERLPPPPTIVRVPACSPARYLEALEARLAEFKRDGFIVEGNKLLARIPRAVHVVHMGITPNPEEDACSECLREVDGEHRVRVHRYGFDCALRPRG